MRLHPVVVLCIAALGSACAGKQAPIAAASPEASRAEAPPPTTPAPAAPATGAVSVEECDRFAAHGIALGAHLQDIDGPVEMAPEALREMAASECIEWKLSRRGYDCFMAAADLDAWNECDRTE